MDQRNNNVNTSPMTDPTIKNATILIVDDKQANLDILEGLLEMQGYENFHTTTDPRQVAGMFHTLHPDLILLDLMMPYLSGFEVMDQLKTLIPASSYLPILVLTADLAVETKQRALAGGAIDFLVKPFDLVEVGLRIGNLLKTRCLHQQLENQNLVLEEKVRERTQNLEMANRQLEAANNELQVLDRAKADFLKLISHEIRTPLNGILGFTSLLKSEIREPELLEYLDFLEISATRLENFSYQALMITDLRTGTSQIRMERVSIMELLDNSKFTLGNKIRSKEINILLQKDHEIGEIKGDYKYLQVCFDCLIDNAVKFSPHGETVTIRISAADHHISCEFIDNGPGFPTKALGYLFELFRVGDEHIDKNTGLNLALIKLIMDAHQGQMEVMNNQPRGATVRLSFNV